MNSENTQNYNASQIEPQQVLKYNVNAIKYLLKIPVVNFQYERMLCYSDDNYYYVVLCELV